MYILFDSYSYVHSYIKIEKTEYGPASLSLPNPVIISRGA